MKIKYLIILFIYFISISNAYLPVNNKKNKNINLKIATDCSTIDCPNGFHCEINSINNLPNCVISNPQMCRNNTCNPNEQCVVILGVNHCIPSPECDCPEGPAGPAGEDGEEGDPGESGTEKGPSGPQGEDGSQGEEGDPGPSGPQGLQGLQGIKGERGLPGINEGPTGPNGDKGMPGIQGVHGERGEQGDIGDEGDEGEVGEIGLDGEQGEQGEQGEKGIVGVMGPTGLQGPTGYSGSYGSTGPRGITGPTGLDGGFVTHAHYYSIAESTFDEVIAPGEDIKFKSAGPNSNVFEFFGFNSINVDRVFGTLDHFVINYVGIYDVTFFVTVEESGGQLVFTEDDVELENTLVGKSIGSNQIYCNFLLNVTNAASKYTVRSPSSNTQDITIKTLSGGTKAVTSHLVFLQVG
ncbi:hypothetical protein ACTA71_005436 [Dictyostelium dimigraforme]